MNVDLSRQVLHENKVFVWVNGLGFSGFVPSPLQPKLLKPFLDWGGGKITMDVWYQVLSFFKDHPTDEVQVRLYHNPTDGTWKPWAFPQEYPSGMTTKELPDHPNTAVDAAQFGEPWVRLGSVHHHCASAAFQSSTDTADESTVSGLHITMGNLRDPKWSIHSRVCIRLPGKLDEEGKLIYGPTQAFYDAVLPQWFDLPESYKAILPAKVQGVVTEMMLVTPPDVSVPYPARWKENLIRRTRVNGAHSHHGYGGYGSDYHQSGYTNPTGPGGASSGSYGHGRVNNILAWEAISPQRMDMLLGLIEVYNDAEGKFICQCIETQNWQANGFHNLLALEGLLRSCGLVQVCNFVWCFPQDKEIVQKVQTEVAEREAHDEIKNFEREAVQSHLNGEGY